MPVYRVRPGQVLPHGGALLEPGTVVELPAHVAADIEVAYRVEEVSAEATAPEPDTDPISQPTGDARPTEE